MILLIELEQGLVKCTILMFVSENSSALFVLNLERSDYTDTVKNY